MATRFFSCRDNPAVAGLLRSLGSPDRAHYINMTHLCLLPVQPALVAKQTPFTARNGTSFTFSTLAGLVGPRIPRARFHEPSENELLPPPGECAALLFRPAFWPPPLHWPTPRAPNAIRDFCSDARANQ